MSLFDLFKHEDPAEQARRAAYQARQAESVRLLQEGGLPLDASERLAHQRAQVGTEHHLWTSDLSVNELALSRDCGFEPLGQVLGASTYHVGFQWGSHSWTRGTAYELEVLTNAFSRARQLALSRLWQEAQLIGAHTVVGVRLEKRNAGWADDLIEFSALGTAVRLHDSPPPDSGPTLCALSGQEFWKLRQAGWEAVGVASGNCSYLCYLSHEEQRVAVGGWLGQGAWQNQELSELTQAAFSARELAQARLIAEAEALGATGTIGMTVQNIVEEDLLRLTCNDVLIGMNFNFLAIGTAIRPLPADSALPIHGALPLRFMRV